MALQLTKELDSGISGDYWKITEIKMYNNGVDFMVSLYKDQAARDAGKLCISKEFRSYFNEENPLTVAAMDALDANPYSLLYDKLKLEDEFSGALDI